jgi:hypothetical protein
VQVQSANYIFTRASLQGTHNVIYVALAAIALAEWYYTGSTAIKFHFFSDCEQLAHLLEFADYCDLLIGG